jgi:hypothetical protein
MIALSSFLLLLLVLLLLDAGQGERKKMDARYESRRGLWSSRGLEHRCRITRASTGE